MVVPRRYTVRRALLASLLISSTAAACLWDYDTIKMERTRFPTTLELLTGKFLRHSPEFYQWRMENRLQRLKSDPHNPELLDDLAVAYDKLGQHDRAIETAIQSEQFHPDRYQTAANLGTFYFHAGRLEESLTQIERALKMNPEAHFGREKYQKLLTEYVLKRRQNGSSKLPLAQVVVEDGVTNPTVEDYAKVSDTFADFIRPKDEIDQSVREESTAAAIKGVLGMMKFARHDSPILLEALGSLLTQGDYYLEREFDAKLLATRAFLKASYEVQDAAARTAYRGMAVNALRMQSPRSSHAQLSLEEVEEAFQNERIEGREWYTQLEERELSWIRSGINPETEFDKLYEAPPEVSGMNKRDGLSFDQELAIGAIVVATIIVLTMIAGLVGIVFLIRRIRRSRPRGTEATETT